MAIDYPGVLALKEEGRRFSWTERDAMLYALGLGFGDDPLDANELDFVYEKNLRVVPTFATVAAWGAGLTAQAMGLDRQRTLHGEERTELHRPFPAEGSLLADSRVVAVYDKGADKGAVVVRETRLKDAQTGEALATLTRTAFARADGGFGGDDAPASQDPARPRRPPDATIDIPTRRNQALLYRLSGDRNPLHADPGVAQASGFGEPILHGLCTYGLTCRAVLQAWCDFDPSRIASHAARFSAPVVPGDLIGVDLWREGKTVWFEAQVKARGVTVIKNGITRLR